MLHSIAKHKIPVALFIFFYSFYLLTARGILSVPDGIINFLTVRSLVERGVFAIDVDCDLLHEFVQVHPSGQCFSKYDPGLAITSIPWYLVGRLVSGPATPDYESLSVPRLWVSTFNQLITAATCVVLYVLAYYFSNSQQQALELVFLFGMATLAWPYATTYFSQPLVGFLLLTAVTLILMTSHKQALLGAGILLGWACITRLDTLPLLLIITVYAGYKICQRAANRRYVLEQLVWLLVPIFLALLFYLWFNQIRSGLIFQFGYAGEGWTGNFWQGAFGLLFSSGRGLIFYSPLVVLAIPGLGLMWRQNFQAESALILVLFLAQIGTYAAWWAWEGGWVWGPRFLVSTQPFLIIGLLPWLNRVRVRPLLLLLIVFGFLVQIIGAMTSSLTYLTRIKYSYDETLFDPVASPLWGQLQDLLSRRVTLLVPSQAYGVLSGGQTIAWVLICLLLLVISATMLLQSMRHPS